MTSALGFAVLALLAIGLVAVVVGRPQVGAERAGKVFIFIAFCLLPIALTTLGTAAHLEHSKSTRFCLSCHVMEPYGKSLHRDDTDYLPAGHFQENRIDRAHACYTCHTTYTLFGGVESKLRGLRHVWVNYVGKPPGTIQLYEPYHNRECLHCHAGGRTFEADEVHAELRGELERNETSCLECHDLAHAVGELEEAKLWGEPARGF